MGSSLSRTRGDSGVGTSGQRIPDSNCDWGSKCNCPNNEHSYSAEYKNNLYLTQKENTSTRNYLEEWFRKREVEPGEEVESKYDDRKPTPSDLRFFGEGDSDEEPSGSDSFDLVYVGECENENGDAVGSPGQLSSGYPSSKKGEKGKKSASASDDA
ncbi:uncharacterized protein [Spinacia oleracea]|uniref:Uncharacterized protein n=1 Tax=Spinacia oleracea TaxID=3562 RepID=A0ABM3RCJ3_SPIOL|nr:uncharacterized protein LOC110799356 [Spinacia oleracea]